MAAGRELLTDRAVKAWLVADGPDALHDGGGLYLRRRADGAYWALRQVNPLTGTRTWASVFPGVPYPTATLAEARRKANAARLTAADSPTDIVREREETKRAAQAAQLAEQRRVTFRQVFDDWRATDLQSRVRADGKRTGRVDGGQYVLEQFTRHVFPSIGGMVLAEVSKADLLALLDAQKSAGKMRTANVLLADIKQMLEFALEREIIDRNPLATVKKSKVGGPSVERDRVLSEEEIRLLTPAIGGARMNVRSATAIWLTLATGVRVGELMGAVWADKLPADLKLRKARLNDLQVAADEEGVKLGIVDTATRTWHLPTTKNQRDHTVHLSDFALQQIRVLDQYREVLAGSIAGELSPWLVGADANLSHRADPILSQGWKPTLRWSAVDKCRSVSGSLGSSVG